MKIPYTPSNHGLQPIILGEIRGPAASVRVPFLIDSGASDCVVPSALLAAAGLPVEGESVSLSGDGGAEIRGSRVDAELVVGGIRFSTPLIGVPEHVPVTPVLGHRDFFLKFWVALDASNGFFYVEPARKR